MTEKISQDVAETEFFRFLDAMGLESDESILKEEDQEDYYKNKKLIVDAIKKGSLFINEEGEPVFKPMRSKGLDQLTFHEPTGASMMAMDKRKQEETIAKLYAAMGEMTRTHPSVFSKMKMTDLKICIAIATLFLA